MCLYFLNLASGMAATIAELSGHAFVCLQQGAAAALYEIAYREGIARFKVLADN